MADQGPDPACVCEGGLALAALIADTFATGDLQKALAVALSPTPGQLKDELEKIRREHKGKDYAGGGCGCWVGGYDYTNVTYAQCVAMGGKWYCPQPSDGDDDKKAKIQQLEKELQQLDEKRQHLIQQLEKLKEGGQR
jgi:hypothetical protein